MDKGEREFFIAVAVVDSLIQHYIISPDLYEHVRHLVYDAIMGASDD